MTDMLRFIFFCLLIKGHIGSSIAQNPERIKLLDEELYNAKTDTTKLRVLNSLFQEYCFSNHEKSKAYNQQILELGEYGDNPIATGQFYHNEGVLSSIAGDFPKSVENYFKTIAIHEQCNNRFGIAKTYSNIGIVYSQLKEDSLALFHYLKSLKIAKEVGNQKLILNNSNNIGNLYIELNRSDSAQYYLINAINIYEQAERDSPDRYTPLNKAIGPVYSNLANIYLKANMPDSAILYLDKAAQLYEIENNRFQIAQNNIIYGRAYRDKNDFVNSLDYFFRAMEFGEEFDFNEIRHRVYWELYQTYTIQHDFEKALAYHELYTSVSDTIYDERKTEMIHELQTRYETQKKQQEIERQQIIIEKRNYLIYSILAILALLSIIAALMVSQVKSREKRNSAELKQKLLRSQMNPHFIFNALASIQGSVLEQSPHEAADYISKFASLMRMILEYSNEEFIPLETEMDILNYYLDLQQLRYGNAFHFEIDVSQDHSGVNVSNVLIPPMLAQPFIENAIEHGIVNQCAKGFINIRFEILENELLFTVENYCIEKLTEKLKPKIQESAKGVHKPMAIAITEERLHFLNKGLKEPIQFEFTEGESARVSFRLPLMT